MGKLKDRAGQALKDQRGEQLAPKARVGAGRVAAEVALRSLLELDPDERVSLRKKPKTDSGGFPVFTHSDDGMDFVIRRLEHMPAVGGLAYRVYFIDHKDDDQEHPVVVLSDLGVLLEG